jgi:hypothetical protein
MVDGADHLYSGREIERTPQWTTLVWAAPA